MALSILNTHQFYQAVLCGADEVIRHKNFLNKINVFPVADGDTGTNLSAMMQSILHQSQVHPNLSETLKSIANASLYGAKGNSGVIFAQFFNGLSEAYDALKGSREENNLPIDTFASSIQSAAKYAYHAISEPVEGTIITVMRDWSKAFERHSQSAGDFVDCLKKSLNDAQLSLEKTASQLKALKNNKVVDSGAQGFVYFIEGLIAHIAGDKSYSDDLKTQADTRDELTARPHAELVPDTCPEHRYCTEAFLAGEDIDTRRIQEAIHHLGDSIVIAGRPDLCRVHIHTNHPSELFKQVKLHGNIEQQKVDDMLRQYHTTHARKHKIALVADSTADLPQAFIDEHQIHLVPINVILDGSTYLDKLSMSSTDLYDQLDRLKDYPSTSQPSYPIVYDLFAKLSQHYDSILVLSVAEAISGTFSVFRTVADKFANQTKISVINTKTSSAAQGLLVRKAAAYIERGLSHFEIIARLNTLIPKTELFVSIENFKYLARSGRVAGLKSWVGRATGLKPIIAMDDDGRGQVINKSLSLNGAMNKLIKTVSQHHGESPIRHYAIVHANAQTKAEYLGEVLRHQLNQPPEYIMNVSPALGIHAGVGAVGIGLLKR